ncbi:MAG: hypothetical protein HYX69_00495 [Planctomycetia bacterium]|nr:hypothetical protein [Planctomycetia bacterium]
MGWEKRGNGRYYTRSRKVKGKVVREYVGGGAIGEAAAFVDAAKRAARQALKRQREAVQAERKASDDLVIGFGQIAELLAGAYLLLSGYHQHAHGPWRKRSGRRRK